MTITSIRYGEEMNLTDLIPISGLPRAENYTSADGRWSFGDSEQSFRSSGGHKLYDETSIAYELNSLRYRCPEFDTEADVRMVSIGCSYTFGVGLPQCALYHELFADFLRSELNASVVNWNLGSASVSNNYVARMLQLALPALRPHVVLILFTHLARREYITSDNVALKYLPSTARNFRDAGTKRAAERLFSLTNQFDDQLNFFRDHKAIQALLKNRLWCYSIAKSSELKGVAQHLDREHRAPDFKWRDLARDNHHPGPETHRDICEGFISIFSEMKGLEHLRRIVFQRTR
jgi:hypothetical protein